MVLDRFKREFVSSEIDVYCQLSSYVALIASALNVGKVFKFIMAS